MSTSAACLHLRECSLAEEAGQKEPPSPHLPVLCLETDPDQACCFQGSEESAPAISSQESDGHGPAVTIVPAPLKHNGVTVAVESGHVRHMSWDSGLQSSLPCRVKLTSGGSWVLGRGCRSTAFSELKGQRFASDDADDDDEAQPTVLRSGSQEAVDSGAENSGESGSSNEDDEDINEALWGLNTTSTLTGRGYDAQEDSDSGKVAAPAHVRRKSCRCQCPSRQSLVVGYGFDAGAHRNEPGKGQATPRGGSPHSPECRIRKNKASLRSARNSLNAPCRRMQSSMDLKAELFYSFADSQPRSRTRQHNMDSKCSRRSSMSLDHSSTNRSSFDLGTANHSSENQSSVRTAVEAFYSAMAVASAFDKQGAPGPTVHRSRGSAQNRLGRRVSL